MSVRIVTDSVADLPAEVVQRLGIEVVPLVVRFGAEEYRDGLDLSPERFYRMLQKRQEFPTTATPSPAAFAEAYDRQAAAAEELLAITVSARLSGTFQAAQQGRNLVTRQARVEVLDSDTATMTEGFVVLRTAEAAQAGASLGEVLEAARRAAARVDFLAYLLKVNPLINLRAGLVQLAGRTRSRARAVDQLYAFAAGYSRTEELAVEHTACPEEAESLIGRLAVLHPRERIYLSKMTLVIGTHTERGLLLVGILGDKAKAQSAG